MDFLWFKLISILEIQNISAPHWSLQGNTEQNVTYSSAIPQTFQPFAIFQTSKMNKFFTVWSPTDMHFWELIDLK